MNLIIGLGNVGSKYEFTRHNVGFMIGEAFRAVIDYYKLGIENTLIVYDDLSLDLGKIRFRANGSDGGHNGIKSIIQHAGTNKISRLKIGTPLSLRSPSKHFLSISNPFLSLFVI